MSLYPDAEDPEASKWYVGFLFSLPMSSREKSGMSSARFLLKPSNSVARWHPVLLSY